MVRSLFLFLATLLSVPAALGQTDSEWTNLVVEELLEQGRLRAVLLEANYSFSGFFDHYASEPDDEKAARFLKTSPHYS